MILHVTTSQAPSTKQEKEKDTSLSLEVAGQLVLVLKGVLAVTHSLMPTEQWSEAPLRPHMILHLQRRRTVASVLLSAEKQELEHPRSVARKSDSGPLARFDVSLNRMMKMPVEIKHTTLSRQSP